MRFTMCGVLVASVLAVGCNRPEAMAPEKPLANPASAAPAANPVHDAAAPPPPASASSAAASPAAPTVRATREINLPAGTQLSVVLDTSVGSDMSRVEEAVAAHLTNPVRVDGETVLAAGSRVTGVVTEATRSARVKGRAHLALRFDSLTPHGDDERYTIRTASIARTAESTKRKDATVIGAPAAGGAIIGALFGGKKGALVGTAIGGGAGTTAVLSTRGKEVQLPKGTALTVRLTGPVTLRVKE
jgi:hypothetical protein